MKVIIGLFPHCGSFILFSLLSLTHLLELRDCALVWGPCLHVYFLAPSLLPLVGPEWAVLVVDLRLEF